MSEQEGGDLTVADELDIWLAMQPRPQSPVIWQEENWHRRTTASRRRLAIQIGRLGSCFDTGYAQRRHAAVSARVRWRDDGYVVDINTADSPRGWWTRISRSESPAAPLADAAEAALVTWAWMSGKVPDGYALVRRLPEWDADQHGCAALQREAEECEAREREQEERRCGEWDY